MKKNTYSLLFGVCLLFMAVMPINVQAQTEIPLMDFESYETTPYLFRFGNQGNQKISDYKPRWVYSHTVVDNPFTTGNSSSKVLEYKSMEAQDYGVKFKFMKPVAIGDLQTISFKIYQPANVIGKPVDTQYNSNQTPATKQRILVKLLADYNSVCDFRSEYGIFLDAVDFSTENEWVTFKFTFNKNNFSSAVLDRFKTGIKGYAILPTYESKVTLAETNLYTCYIDEISINEVGLGIENNLSAADEVYFANGNLFVPTLGAASVSISVYDMLGMLNIKLEKQDTAGAEILSVPLNLESKPYIVVVVANGQTFRKIIYPS